jgi:NADH-quinone oxidoreductase subunit G
MKHMIIDGISCEFENERNVLELAQKNHIDIPNLCYCESLSIYGGCRLCVVENERGGIEAACSMIPKDGMSIKTNTARLRKHRQMILELLLAGHRSECTTCEKSEKCKLRAYAQRYNVTNIRFPVDYPKLPIDDSSPSIIRDPSKCILCGKCVRMCSEVQNIHAVDFAERGIEAYITCGFDNKLADTDCVACGQCAAVCPTGALVIRNEVSKLWTAIYDPSRKVAVQVAPAVRVGIGEEFGLPASQPVMGKITTALKMLGVDYVFDTSLTADLTIMEESAEFLNKLKNGDKLPLFTSCCPGWIKHVENRHPHLMPQVSTCGSPMEMFGAVLRQYYTEDELYSVAIMPCTAKKAEAARPELVKDGERLIDLVLTTQELARMIKEAGIDFAHLPDSAPDDPFAEYTGAGVIFGVTGGVTEAVIRHVLGTVTSEQIADVAECGVRGLDGIKAFEVTAGDVKLKIAVANGLGNADKLIEKIESGEEFFHFVEIMACPGGCIGGGGQPEACLAQKKLRNRGIFAADEQCTLRSSEQNTALDGVYTLLRGRAHELLHVHYPDHGHE